MRAINNISLILLLITMAIQGCMSQDEKVNCLNELTKKQNNQELTATLEDSINSWSKRQLKSMARFNQDTTTWKIDALIENSTADKLFGWILQVDNDTSKNALDYVKYYSGEKRGGQWFFYLHNMRKTWADRKDNGNQKYTFDQLSRIAIKQVARGGLVKRNCEIDDAYINGWIDREGRNLYEWHQSFLQSSTE